MPICHLSPARRPTPLALCGTLLAALLASGVLEAAAGQQPGRIVGRIIDARTGTAVPAAEVRVAGTTRRALSGPDGAFALDSVPAGRATLQATHLGYATRTLHDIAVPPGGTARREIELEPRALRVPGITASVARTLGSTTAALEAQRAAPAILHVLARDQLARSPDGDAATAARRLTGITLHDGRLLLIRGLGDRYTATTLDGIRIPSPEPEQRTVPLDLFPAGLLQAIAAWKSYTPDQPGDIAAGRLDLKIRDAAGPTTRAFAATTTANGAILGRDHLSAPGTPLDRLAFGARRRTLPAPLTRLDLVHRPPPPDAIPQLVHSFRNAWSPVGRTGTPGASLSATLGGSSTAIGANAGYTLAVSYATTPEVHAEERRATALPGPGGETREADRFRGATGRRGVLWGALLDASVLTDARTRLAVTHLYVRSADVEARTETGASENLGLRLRIDRLRYVERAAQTARLALRHEPSGSHRLDARLALSRTIRREPDRSEFVSVLEDDPATGTPLPPAWFSISNQAAVRTFGDLVERAGEAALDWQWQPAGTAGPAARAGLLVRLTRRRADNRAFSISAPGLDRETRELRPETLFDGRLAGPGSPFQLTPLGVGGSYRSAGRHAAAYLMATFHAGPARATAGARLERDATALDAEPTIGDPLRTTATYTDLLPALAVDLPLGRAHVLRAAASRTVARPEYRELAPIQYRDVIGGEIVQGNPALRRARVDSYDLRWEWYPAPGMVASAGAFLKRFHQPIERVYLATSGTRIVTFANAQDATSRGLELELRQRLGPLARPLDPLELAANLTVLSSDIRAGDRLAALTRTGRALVGQAPYALNLAATWSHGRRASASLLYHVVGPRLVAASEAPLPDPVERPRHLLDLALRLPARRSVMLRIDAQNLLDAPHRVTQGEVTLEGYRTGRTLAIGLAWGTGP